MASQVAAMQEGNPPGSNTEVNKSIVLGDAVYIIKRSCSADSCYFVICAGIDFGNARHNCVRVESLDAEHLARALRLINARCSSLSELLSALNVARSTADQVIQSLCRW
jgi:hypothetical protein